MNPQWTYESGDPAYRFMCWWNDRWHWWWQNPCFFLFHSGEPSAVQALAHQSHSLGYWIALPSCHLYHCQLCIYPSHHLYESHFLPLKKTNRLSMDFFLYTSEKGANLTFLMYNAYVSNYLQSFLQKKCLLPDIYTLSFLFNVNTSSLHHPQKIRKKHSTK